VDRLLIIGASGLVGSRLSKLAENRYEVFGTYFTHPMTGPNLFPLDTRDRPSVVKLIEKVKPAFVVDTHSLNNVDYCEVHRDEAWDTNVGGSRNVAEAAKQFGSKYVFLSTDYVFDGRKLKYTEKDKPHPLCYFAMTRVVTEQMLEAFDMNYLVARTAVVYGMGGLNKVSFAVWLINKLRAGETVTIVNDQKNNPTFADNLVAQLLALYEKDATGLFHITGSQCISRFDFSKEIAREFELDSELIKPITTPELHQTAPRAATVNLSTAKVQRLTGISTLNVREGLDQLREQMEDQTTSGKA
jgi:dTDP-4-dehydrorhamnose reductase